MRLLLVSHIRVTASVISVISFALVCVGILDQPDSELDLTMPSITRWVCMGCQQPNCCPALYFSDRNLSASATMPEVLYATSRIGACAKSPSCPGPATVMPEAGEPQAPGLLHKHLEVCFNMLNNTLQKS